MGINWLVQGIECRKAPESLPDEGGKAREGYGRSAGTYLEGQRIGTNGRPRGARLSNGRPRGPEALRVFRRTGVGGHQWLYGDARHAAGTPLGLSCGTRRVRGWRAHGFGAPQALGPPRSHRVHVDGHEEGPLGQADLGYRRWC